MSFFGYMKGIYVLLNDEIRPNVGLVRIDRVYMLIGNWSTYIDEALKQTTNVVQWQSSNQIIIVVISSVIRLNSYSWRSIYILRCGNYHNNSECVHLRR